MASAKYAGPRDWVDCHFPRDYTINLQIGLEAPSWHEGYLTLGFRSLDRIYTRSLFQDPKTYGFKIKYKHFLILFGELKLARYLHLQDDETVEDQDHGVHPNVVFPESKKYV
jgi:hypothetical protein